MSDHRAKRTFKPIATSTPRARSKGTFSTTMEDRYTSRSTTRESPVRRSTPGATSAPEQKTPGLTSPHHESVDHLAGTNCPLSLGSGPHDAHACPNMGEAPRQQQPPPVPRPHGAQAYPTMGEVSGHSEPPRAQTLNDAQTSGLNNVLDSQTMHTSWSTDNKSIETTIDTEVYGSFDTSSTVLSDILPERSLEQASYGHSVFDIFHIDETDPPKNSITGEMKPQVTMVEFAPYQGKPPGPYLPNSEWRIWLKRVENFMRLRKVSDDSKKFVFLDEIGDVNYCILEGLLPGKELEEYSYEELKAAMTARFQPKTLVMSERFRLTQLTQKSGQDLAEFLAELQSAARSCEFEKITDVRDAFVALAFISGVRSNDTRMKLIEQTGKDSSQLLALAEAHERAGRGAKELHHTGLDTVHAVRGRKGEHPNHRTRKDSDGHNQKERTRAQTQRQKYCHICKSNGHRTDDCRYNGLNESANVVSEDEASLYEYDIDHIQLHAVDLMSSKVPPKCLIKAEIGMTPIDFELDTGSGVSVIGFQTWKALGSPKLQETHRVAKAYGGQLLRFRGVLQTEVKFGSKRILTRLFVLNKSSPSIWGRESIQTFDIDLGPVYRHGIQRAAEVTVESV